MSFILLFNQCGLAKAVWRILTSLLKKVFLAMDNLNTLYYCIWCYEVSIYFSVKVDESWQLLDF